MHVTSLVSLSSDSVAVKYDFSFKPFPEIKAAMAIGIVSLKKNPFILGCLFNIGKKQTTNKMCDIPV